MKLTCAHCDGVAQIRSSRKTSKLNTDLYVQCLDPHCGHTWKSTISVTYTIAPSVKPNPAVLIPMYQGRSTYRKASK